MNIEVELFERMAHGGRNLQAVLRQKRLPLRPAPRHEAGQALHEVGDLSVDHRHDDQDENRSNGEDPDQEHRDADGARDRLAAEQAAPFDAIDQRVEHVGDEESKKHRRQNSAQGVEQPTRGD